MWEFDPVRSKKPVTDKRTSQDLAVRDSEDPLLLSAPVR